MRQRLSALAALVALAVTVAPIAAGGEGLKKGTVTLKSAGPLAFGPDGVLLVGDPTAAVVYAIDTGDRTPPGAKAGPKVEGIDAKVAALLGTKASEVRIADLAVNPKSGNTYLSVARGTGPSAAAILLRLSPEGKLSEVPLADVPMAKADLPRAAAGKGKGGRADVLTHIGYVKGRVLVAGLSNEEWTSTFRSIPYPFSGDAKVTGVGIFHGAHGRFETNAPVRVFAPYQIKGEDHLLAAYTCTPLVRFPVSDLQPGAKVKGTTVAELGNRNRPLSMIVYNKGGKDYVLMANSSRGLMKINLLGVDTAAGIVSRVADKAGLGYTTIEGLGGVQKLDAFGREHAVILIRDGGSLNLRTIDLP